MSDRFQFRPYQRRFRQPLTTSHGVWAVREGIILRLRDTEGKVGWGEIAPLPWFGSETLAEALRFCQELTLVTEETIRGIPDELPACQFGFESAWSDLSLTKSPLPPLSYSYLLPTGEAALSAWQPAWQEGGRTFKWKIGIRPLEEEINIFQQLLEALPMGGKLRLDANGGLNLEAAKVWLQKADQSNRVEFIEQPLPPEQFDELLKLRADYATPLALDESVANLKQLQKCYQRWRGIFVIKAAIFGSPRRLRQFCQEHPIDAVFSSVFETAIGTKAALNLAAELSHPSRAVGFGVKDWFEEDEWFKHPWF